MMKKLLFSPLFLALTLSLSLPLTDSMLIRRQRVCRLFPPLLLLLPQPLTRSRALAYCSASIASVVAACYSIACAREKPAQRLLVSVND